MIEGDKECKKELQDLLENMDDWIQEKDWSMIESSIRRCNKKLTSLLFAIYRKRRDE
jgi:hypothetical protein